MQCNARWIIKATGNSVINKSTKGGDKWRYIENKEEPIKSYRYAIVKRLISNGAEGTNKNNKQECYTLWVRERDLTWRCSAKMTGT